MFGHSAIVIDLGKMVLVVVVVVVVVAAVVVAISITQHNVIINTGIL